MFIYTSEFDKLWKSIFKDIKNLEEVEQLLLQNPKAGNVIKGTEGLRKLSWRLDSKGKRGGIRILYVDFELNQVLIFVTLILKNEKANISETDKKIINSLIKTIKLNLENYGKK